MTDYNQTRSDALDTFRQNHGTKCYQKCISDTVAKNDSSPHPSFSLDSAEIKQITKEESKRKILQYEWLGTTGRRLVAYGLFVNNELLGLASFGVSSGSKSADICGPELKSKTICLERGLCVHFAPKNTASFLISRAVKQARKDFGWEIFFAYADEDAGEIGTVYQACNWLYLGCGVGRKGDKKRKKYLKPDGKIVSSRTMRFTCGGHAKALEMGWKEAGYATNKHKYVWFEGTQKRKRQLKKLCRFEFKEYPKRKTETETA